MPSKKQKELLDLLLKSKDENEIDYLKKCLKEKLKYSSAIFNRLQTMNRLYTLFDKNLIDNLPVKDKRIYDVYVLLRSRTIHPSGNFDSKGRWYSSNNDLIDVRQPSKAYPYSQMTACRTLKYVKAVAKKYNCKTFYQLKRCV
jgi:hypothetical protein